jgi:hypothetical protein
MKNSNTTKFREGNNEAKDEGERMKDDQMPSSFHPSSFIIHPSSFSSEVS